MKLRFHDNSLRLRLSQSEVTQLRDAGHVENSVTFRPGQKLLYRLEISDVPEVAAHFEEGCMSVKIPRDLALDWIDGDRAGIEASEPALHILIEKDYQCLHRGPEHSPDAFPNPAADKSAAY